MYITAGFMSMLLKQFEDVDIDISKIFSAFNTALNVLESPLEKIDAGILGRYLELVVAKKKNHRIGLETGFILPFIVTGAIFNICRKSTTVRELFENPFDFIDPTENDIHEQTTRVDGDLFYFELAVSKEFSEIYPIASRQWLEMQYGIALQFAYSFFGRYLCPVLAHSIYAKEGEEDKLSAYISCPVKFEQDKFALIYNKSVQDVPVVTLNKDLLPIFEDYMHEIRRAEEQQNANWSNSVRRYLMHSLSTSNLTLDIVAERFNVSKRNLHRKLREEGTSYQQILDSLRMELSKKYLKEKISLVEIAYLLGFESQSAFNKFFQKHFHIAPSKFH